MLCTRSAWAIAWLLSTSIFASTQEPPPSAASRSSTGESCLHGPHHSAHRSSTTGTWNERSSTSAWKLASVTSTTVTGAAGRGAVAGDRRVRVDLGLGLGALPRLGPGPQDGQIDRAGQRGGQGWAGRGTRALLGTTWLHATSLTSPAADPRPGQTATTSASDSRPRQVIGVRVWVLPDQKRAGSV